MSFKQQTEMVRRLDEFQRASGNGAPIPKLMHKEEEIDFERETQGPLSHLYDINIQQRDTNRLLAEVLNALMELRNDIRLAINAINAQTKKRRQPKTRKAK